MIYLEYLFKILLFFRAWLCLLPYFIEPSVGAQPPIESGADECQSVRAINAINAAFLRKSSTRYCFP